MAQSTHTGNMKNPYPDHPMSGGWRVLSVGSCNVSAELRSQFRNRDHWHAAWPEGGHWCYETRAEAAERVAECRALRAEATVNAVRRLLFRNYMGSPSFGGTSDHITELDALADLYDAALAGDLRALLDDAEVAR